MAIKCDKQSFASRQDATYAMVGMQGDKSRRSKKQPRAVYFCDGCQAWHITSKKKKNYPVVTTSETKFKKGVDRVNANNNGQKTLVIKNFTSKPIK